MKTIRFESEQDFENMGIIARALVRRECQFTVPRRTLLELGAERGMRLQHAMERAAEFFLAHEPLSEAFQVADGIHRVVVILDGKRAESLLFFAEEGDLAAFWQEIRETFPMLPMATLSEERAS